MRDHSKHVEVSRDEAIRLLLEGSNFEPRTEFVPLSEAVGRVLAKDVLSLVDVPNKRSCRMDSVAVHWADFEYGMPDTTGWQRGVQWQFANTGIVMPDGFDTAIVIEHVELSDDLSQISFLAAPTSQFAGTSAVGSKLACGDVVAKAGQVVTPLLLSGIAAGNVREVEVIAKPRVAFIPTGNELVHAAPEIPLGRNIETNSILFSEKVKGWGCEPLTWEIVKDDPALIRQAVVDACAQADIVILNAGSSKGSDDWNVEMLDEVGTILYHQVNHGPGHHCSGAVVDGTPVVGISGPPGGVSFTTDFYVYPLAMRYIGQPEHMQTVQARLASPFPVKKKSPKAAKGETRPSVVKPGDEFFGVRQVALSVAADGVLEARPASSAHLSPLVADTMDGYVLVGNIKPVPEVGDIITVELRPR